MPIQVFGAPAAVIMLNRAFNDTSPGNLIYQNQVAAATSNLTTFANDFAAGFASLSDSALANLVLGNLGLLPNTALADALAAYYTANGAANRGLVTLQLGQVLAAKEGDATYGAAATAWNDEVASGFNYSANTANTATSGSGSSSAGQTFTLTTGIDIRTGTSGSDTFDGSVNANGTATLTSVDQLNGGDGADQLIAGLGGGTLAAVATTTGLTGCSTGRPAEAVAAWDGPGDEPDPRRWATLLEVLEVDAPSGAAGQVLLDPLANGVTALFGPGAGPVVVAVEVEQLTPVQLVGRAAGQSAASDPVQLRP